MINYDFPQSTVSYIHRIGRTGRAGRSGKAVTFFTEADVEYLRAIANVMKASGCEVPDWMLQLKSARKDVRRRRNVAPVSRKVCNPLACTGALVCWMGLVPPLRSPARCMPLPPRRPRHCVVKCYTMHARAQLGHSKARRPRAGGGEL